MPIFVMSVNDLTEIKTAELVNNITSDILRIKLLFSNAEVIWSEILMRRYWLNANDGKAVELASRFDFGQVIGT
jgi:hypothetical protein